MRYELHIARHISLRGGRVGVRIAVAGVALALATMLVAVAVCQGFKREIRAKVMGFDAQLTVVPADPEKPVVVGSALVATVKSVLPTGASVVPVARQPAILKTDSAFAGIIVKGIQQGHISQDFISQSLVEGRMPAEDKEIVISRVTADKLGVGCGDKLYAYFTVGDAVKARRILVSGIYDTHFGDYDKMVAIGRLSLLQKLNRVGGNTCSALEINGLASDDEIEDKTHELRDALAHALYEEKVDKLYTVANVHESGALYFNWLSLLDTNVVVLLTLMAIVASFTLISSLIVIILERVNMIGILKALGATDKGIGLIFILVAERLVLRGLLLGDAIGLGLIFLQKWTGFVPMNPEAYYLDKVPVEIDVWWIVGINLCAVLIAGLVLVLPARIIATISPSKAIRWE